MKINVKIWQEYFTKDLVKTYNQFLEHKRKEHYVQACSSAELFFNQFIRLYSAIDIIQKSKLDKSDKKGSQIDRTIANY